MYSRASFVRLKKKPMKKPKYKQILLTQLSLELTTTFSLVSINRIFSELLRLGGTGGAASLVGEHSLGEAVGDGGGR